MQGSEALKGDRLAAVGAKAIAALVPGPQCSLIRPQCLYVAVDRGVFDVREQIHQRLVTGIANPVRNILGPVQIRRQHLVTDFFTQIRLFLLQRVTQNTPLLARQTPAHLTPLSFSRHRSG